MKNTKSIKHSEINVIYAEDEDHIRESLSTFLRKMIFPNLHVASNGLEALEKFKELHKQGITVDLVITDITMPEMDGFEFIEKSRNYNEDLFALVISGLDFGPYFSKINAISVRTQYIIKPVNLYSLMTKIKEILEKIELNKQFKYSQILAEQYKFAIDNSAIISKTDVDGIITYVNDRFCEIYGYSKEELIGKKHNILKTNLINDSLYKELWDTILAKKIFKYENFPNKAKNGSIYYINSTIVPILGIDGEIKEYLSINYDNTAVIKSLEEEKKAKEMQALFLANMSHEIRTPLNAIVGFTKLLNDSNLDEDDKNYVNIINDNAHLLVNTIGEILDFSKIRSGKMELENIYFKPYKEFNSIKNLYVANASSKNVTLKLDIDEKLENFQLYGDITKLKQVLSNLLSNAIKFTPEAGKVILSIKVEKIQNGDIFLNFSVKDNGIGIDKDKLEDIFKPFTQENQSTTRQYGGTGLGLSICNEIISFMNSELKVHSKKDQGSMFYFRLSFKYKMDNQEEDEVENIIAENSQVIFENCNVLVAEDVEINQKLLNALLRKVQINANFVFNGKEAVDYFDTNHQNIDIIFLDINMPIMDGEEALKHILELQSRYNTSIPIIALTANAVKGDKERFLSLGFDNYISKPINFDHLVDVLKSHIKYKVISKNQNNKIENSEIEDITNEENINLEEIADSLSLPYDFYLELLNDFENMIDSELNILENYIKEENREKVNNQAHKLKGLCGNMGFKDLFELFLKLESFGNFDNSLDLLNDAKRIILNIKKSKK